MKARERKIEVEHRIVGHALASGAEVREVAHEKRLEVEAQVVETLLVQGHELDGIRLVR